MQNCNILIPSLLLLSLTGILLIKKSFLSFASSFSISSVENNMKWNQSGQPRGSALQASKLWNVKTGQNNLWTGPKAALYPQRLFAKITRKQKSPLWIPVINTHCLSWIAGFIFGSQINVRCFLLCPFIFRLTLCVFLPSLVSLFRCILVVSDFTRVVPSSWLLCPFPMTTSDSLLPDTHSSELTVYSPALEPRIREAKRTKNGSELTDRDDWSTNCFYPCSESGIKYKREEMGLKLLVKIFYWNIRKLAQKWMNSVMKSTVKCKVSLKYMQTGTATVENRMEFPQKIRNGTAFWPSDSTSGIIS